MSHKGYTNEKNVQIVLALLKAHNIRKVVASPGATNITVVASMQQDPWFEMYSSVDERSAAYIACGLAEESGEPVVLSCTGATASRNYEPGMTEAYYRKLPILALTSTQNTNRIGHLIAQNVDRSVLPNDIATVRVNIPMVRDVNDAWECEVKANEAMLALRRNGGGPVHINLATSYSRDYSVEKLPEVRSIMRYNVHDKLPELPSGRIAVFVGSHKQWTAEETAALDSFCATNNAVVFCDHTSGYKGKYRVLYALVASQLKRANDLRNIDLCIHIGEISGDYFTLGLAFKNVWRVNADGELRDTFRKITKVFEMPEISFFKHYSREGANETSLLDAYLADCEQTRKMMPEIPFGNLWVAKQLSGNLPQDSVLHLGILNTLRSWNMFEIPASVRSYCNVGGFGIDGGVSSLIGASLVDRKKIYIGIVGDLAFFYDMNAIGNRHVGNNCRILIINNGRGVEFRNYAHQGSVFGEQTDTYIAAAGHYGNKSPMLVKSMAEALGYEYMSASDKDEFTKVYERFVTPKLTDKPMIFEVFTNTEDESSALEIMRNYMQGVPVAAPSKQEEKEKPGLLKKLIPGLNKK